MRLLSFLAVLTLISGGLHAAPPNIVFVLSDDHSYPFLGCYGRTDMKTPHFDKLAAEGMKFHRMFTGAPQCVPSRATFLTGRSAVACRITRFSSPLPRDEITYPEILKKEAGYFVGVLGRSYHLDGSARGPGTTARVFEENNLQTFKERFDYVDASGQGNIPETMKAFFDQRPADQPYYLWVNFSDPHHPWDTGENPPDPASIKVPGSLPDLPGVREDLSRHMGEIEHMDGDFKRVLEIIKDRAGLENTLIVFTGDNGMAFPSGKGNLHDPGLNVPLIVWWPGVVKPGMESRVLISGEDMAPTFLEAAGLPVPDRISGKSFLPLLRGQAFEPRTHIFAERGPHGSATFDENVRASGVDYSRAVRSDRYKLIYNVTPSHTYAPVDSAGGPGWKDIVKAHEEKQLASEFETLWFTSPRAIYELYDLEADPNELRNLAGQPDMKDTEQQLKEALQEKMILDFDYLPLPLALPPKKKAGGQKQGSKNDPSREAQFIQKDTDNDGVLSWEEFSKGRSRADAEGWFKARDQDGNDSLSREEFVTGNVPNPPKKP
ncbi:sulfatase-like hydrolase/transferase [Prosthecobacter sp. SYSU 5D2]|uniref:sulfatase-like hydrolase/transferase n=1 Tax=Prosthecobacter sp. SYSU 5D2 TaxID=3134134 RepID=UPI0031FE9429